MTAPQSVFVSAYAKVNLTLDVLGKRDDGYHALASVMQTIALHDTLRISVNTGGGITFVCDDSTLRGEGNLAFRAAQLMRAEIGDERLGAAIELHKDVPIQAGLGGGSSDAAAVLHALNTQWQVGYPVETLEDLGARLGSDVPFFLRSGTALIEGRGEYVTPLPDAEPLWILLAKPRIGLSTATVFRQLTPGSYSDGTATERTADAIRTGQPIALSGLFNALESGVVSSFSEVRALRDAMLDGGAPVVRMSGSGPTLFAPFRELARARAAYDTLSGAAIDVWLTNTVTSLQARVALPNT
ncbi:MAG TPA: 4-(cytidine 5'-diphospho)-2-C-methyl-D-erythritol kinase [Ktedonobacterales bacterium]|nr:4-(cytidine 5'-diphospho)-2-C-methyl-D-erythritol kinase [Ktedonobacterales bacterium]